MSDSSPVSGKHMPKDYLWVIRKIGRKSRGSVARRSTVVLFPLKRATLVFLMNLLMRDLRYHTTMLVSTMVSEEGESSLRMSPNTYNWKWVEARQKLGPHVCV